MRFTEEKSRNGTPDLASDERLGGELMRVQAAWSSRLLSIRNGEAHPTFAQSQDLGAIERHYAKREVELTRENATLKYQISDLEENYSRLLVEFKKVQNDIIELKSLLARQAEIQQQPKRNLHEERLISELSQSVQSLAEQQREMHRLEQTRMEKLGEELQDLKAAQLRMDAQKAFEREKPAPQPAIEPPPFIPDPREKMFSPSPRFGGPEAQPPRDVRSLFGQDASAPAEKGFFQGLMTWWTEPVLTFSFSNLAGKKAAEADDLDGKVIS